MVATVPSAAVMGLDVRRVRVEVSITRGTPMIRIVGLAESAVREGRERIRAAAAQLGLHVPGLRITVNLAPAGLRKHGAAFDLPIVVAILAAAGQVPAPRARRWVLVGELGLDGSLRAVRGALPIALHAARSGDVAGLLVPLSNLRETRAAEGIRARGAATLVEALAFLRGAETLPGPEDLPSLPEAPVAVAGLDLAEVYGQARGKRALEVAAAGGHNLLLRGEPGAGKTTLARCLPGLLPPLSQEEAVEVTAIHSVAGRLQPGAGLLRARPFRAPHHTVSHAGLVGGGSLPRPGEVSLAHRGVLFLDELAEFPRRTLEVLRQPIEEGRIHIVRARSRATFPARFTLAAAMNPCPCGYHTAPGERCACQPAAVRRYTGRVSGPLLDRIDLHVDVPAVAWEELASGDRGRDSAAVAARVRAARERASARLGPGRCNADMSASELGRFAAPDAAAASLLRRAVERHGLSVRAYQRIRAVARTVADLAGRERVRDTDVAEAVGYRVLDRRAGPGGARPRPSERPGASANA